MGANALKFLVLGVFRGYADRPEFPLDVERIEEVYDTHGEVDHFVIVTVSGERYHVRVDYEPPTEVQ